MDGMYICELVVAGVIVAALVRFGRNREQVRRELGIGQDAQGWTITNAGLMV